MPNTSPTAASSGSDLNGMAVLDACEKIKQELQSFARETLGWQAPLQFDNAVVRSGDQQLEFGDFVMQARMARTPLSATGYYKTPDIHWDKEKGIGQPFYYFATGAAVSEVEVQTLTGEYEVRRVDILHDVGRSLNPAIDRGQIEGGFIQGMGWLTTEELLWDDQGRVISNSPANYKIPSAHDCPAAFNIKLYDVDNHVNTVHKSKAVGEPPLMLAISVWCALRDACAAAGNHKILPKLAVPATPEQVYWAIQSAKAAES